MIVILNGDGQAIDIDVVTRVQHDGTAEATSYPVESGTEIVDSVLVNSDRVILDGEVSNTPLVRPIFGVDDATLIDSQFLLYDRPLRRQSEIEQELNRIRVTRELITVLTPIRTYLNMILEVVQLSRETGSGGRLMLHLEFKQVRTALLRLVTVTLPEPKESRGKKSKSRGKQGTKASTDSQEDELVSILGSIGSAAGVLGL